MDINAYLRRGREAVEDGEFELAERYFNSVLEEAPEHPEALEGLQSIKIAQARRGWGPIGRWTVFLWCNLLRAFGKRQAALEKLRILFASNPTNQRFAEAYGSTAAEEDALDEASTAFKTVLKLEPNRVSALRGMADVLRRQDKPAEAVKCYQKLRSLRPDDDEIQHTLRNLMAQDYARSGIPEDIKKARREIEKEKSQRIRVPGTPEFTERLEKLAEQCEKHPEDLDLRLELAKHLRRGGQLQLAQRELSNILDENSTHWNARVEQASLWRESQELDLAVSLYGQLVKENPEDEDLRCIWLETSLEKAHRDGRADDDPQVVRLRREVFKRRKIVWEKHLDSHPEDLETRLKLAQLLLESGDTTEAITHTQRVIQTPAFAGRGFLLLGKCFRAQDKREIAVEQFQKSIETARNKGYSHIPSEQLKAAHYWLGVTLEEMGQLDEARDAYGQVYAADIGYEDIRERYERATAR